jgi:hypothetical protein
MIGEEGEVKSATDEASPGSAKVELSSSSKGASPPPSVHYDRYGFLIMKEERPSSRWVRREENACMSYTAASLYCVHIFFLLQVMYNSI